MMDENNRFKDQVILVSGGAGFIGSNLCEALLKYDISELRIVDNLSTGKKQNLEDLLSDRRVKFFELDILEFEQVEHVMSGVHICFHQAAMGSVPKSIKVPRAFNDVNVTGFLNILESVRLNGVQRLVYASSSSIYGDSTELPKMEDRIGKPISPYALTKLINEQYAEVYSKVYDVESIGLRYFNVFGPKQNPSGAYAAVIPIFAMKLLRGEQPIINGDPSFTRDFTYIDNVVEANILAALTTRTEAINQSYNVASGSRTSLMELVEAINSCLGIDIRPKIGMHREGDIPHSQAGIDKISKNLGFRVVVPFEEGVSKALSWYKDLLENSSA